MEEDEEGKGGGGAGFGGREEEEEAAEADLEATDTSGYSLLKVYWSDSASVTSEKPSPFFRCQSERYEMETTPFGSTFGPVLTIIPGTGVT